MLKITNVKPLFDSVLTTGDVFESDQTQGNIILQDETKGDLKLYQTVIAVGSVVKDIKPGDKVMIDILPYAQMKYNKNSLQNDMDNNKRIKWHLPWVTIYDEKDEPHNCLLLSSRDIKYVFEGEEVKESKVLVPDTKIVTLS